MCIGQYFLFSVAFLALAFIVFLVKRDKKRREEIIAEDTFFLIFLLIRSLYEDVEKMKGKVNIRTYETLKRFVDQIKKDFFDKLD